jgi:hypothetical protein
VEEVAEGRSVVGVVTVVGMAVALGVCMMIVRGVMLAVLVGAVVERVGGLWVRPSKEQVTYIIFSSRKLLSSWHLVVASGRRWITSAF